MNDKKNHYYLLKFESGNGFRTQFLRLGHKNINKANIKQATESAKEASTLDGLNIKGVIVLTSVSYLGKMTEKEWLEDNG